MRKSNSLPTLIFVVIVALGLALAYAIAAPPYFRASGWIVVVTFFVAFTVAYAVKVADQWERVVVLRLGRFRALKGPGLFFIAPIIETVPYWIDIRVIASAFKAEKTLTKDTVPVDVDAVLFWKVVDATKAALDVADYNGAINWAAQTALRDVIGKTLLADMLEGREKISAELQRIIDVRTEPWGINVISVEVKDVLIPPTLQEAMSMQAQAERERHARVILGDSERQVAGKFAEAARTYASDLTAFHLRAMNMLYEGLKRDNGHRAEHGGGDHATRRLGRELKRDGRGDGQGGRARRRARPVDAAAKPVSGPGGQIQVLCAPPEWGVRRPSSTLSGS
jgi:regulator of protease activity HflC (stomatin/prohibitin superfamily)